MVAAVFWLSYGIVRQEGRSCLATCRRQSLAISSKEKDRMLLKLGTLAALAGIIIIGMLAPADAQIVTIVCVFPPRPGALTQNTMREVLKFDLGKKILRSNWWPFDNVPITVTDDIISWRDKNGGGVSSIDRNSLIRASNGEELDASCEVTQKF